MNALEKANKPEEGGTVSASKRKVRNIKSDEDDSNFDRTGTGITTDQIKRRSYKY